MTRHYVLNAQTDRLDWRRQLIKEIEPEDEVVIELHEPVSFTHLRQLITSLNTVAWQRQATLRYSDESTAVRPPLAIRYSQPPSITTPKM